MKKLRLFGRDVPLPQSRPKRVALGTALCVGGLVGFLPVVGFWMLPLGIAVLAVDSPRAQRLSNRVADWFARRRGRAEAAQQAGQPPGESRF